MSVSIEKKSFRIARKKLSKEMETNLFDYETDTIKIKSQEMLLFVDG
jgi:hypothetical protein